MKSQQDDNKAIFSKTEKLYLHKLGFVVMNTETARKVPKLENSYANDIDNVVVGKSWTRIMTFT